MLWVLLCCASGIKLCEGKRVFNSKRGSVLQHMFDIFCELIELREKCELRGWMKKQKVDRRHKVS